MQVACRFAEYGCWVLDAKTVVDQHEKTCRFWKVKCPFHSHNCYGYLMPIHDIPQHFIDWHRGQWEELDEGREDYFTISYTGYDLESELDWSFPFMCDGKHFILIVSSCEDENWAVCFIYILGSEQDANQYGCTLEISDDDKVIQRVDNEYAPESYLLKLVIDLLNLYEKQNITEIFILLRALLRNLS